MKNAQIIDGAENCVYDIFSTGDNCFEVIFPNGTDIAFIDEIYANPSNDAEELDRIFSEMWSNPVEKRDVQGIHGIIFYELEQKKEILSYSKRYRSRESRRDESEMRRCHDEANDCDEWVMPSGKTTIQ